MRGGGEKLWIFHIFWVLKEHIKNILRKYGDWLVIRIFGGARPFPSLEYWGFPKRVANFMHPVKYYNHDFHLDSRADKHAGVVKLAGIANMSCIDDKIFINNSACTVR